MKLLKNIRFYVLSANVLLSLFIYLYVQYTVPAGTIQTIRITQVYALLSLGYLYLALLAGPFCYTFRSFRFRAQFYKSRRALGVSAFYFGLLHSSYAFFGQLGGFTGLSYLSGKYLLAISLSFTALLILGVMAATSFDYMVGRLTSPRWKLLHRFVYLAAVLVLIHALMLGTHFSDLSALIPAVFFGAFAFLMILEGPRIDSFIMKKFSRYPRFGPATVIFAALILSGIGFSLLSPAGSGGSFSLGIHSQHIQLAREAQTGGLSGLNNSSAKVPGLTGDRTKRYTVSFLPPQNPQAGQDMELRFRVYDASTGNPVRLFSKVYEKIAHLIIVDSSLNYFTHIHPGHEGNEFTITTQFPKDGVYHLYLDYQPLGAIEQQVAFTLPVGIDPVVEKPAAKPGGSLVKEVEGYQVALKTPDPLSAAKLSVGEQKLLFTIQDAASKKPVKTLKPYLASFGHLVMINEKTYDYLHVHPANQNTPVPDSNGGPDVEFLPLGLYGPIKPGIYRLFAQFNPNGQLILTDYTVTIER